MVLTFDQIAFFTGLHMLTDAGLPVLLGGWIAKMGAVLLYSTLAALYLMYFERPLGRRHTPRLADVFDMLTYRERYEDLLARTGCDALTGALDRHSLESYGRRAVEAAVTAGRPISLLLIDIDHFKAFNDQFGHAAGDKMLKRITAEIMAAARLSDFTYRFGGEEFVVIADDVDADEALTLADRVRRRIATSPDETPALRVSASIGVATTGDRVVDYDTLFELADKRLYEAKDAGRNCVVGDRVVLPENRVRLAAG
jgi:diguanylate cyclase (GGDEF)-like protein